MSVLAQDLSKGLDLTVQPSWSGADANQLVDAGTPASDKGLIITTTDSGSTPDVPDASVDSVSPVKKLRWQRYAWRRIRNSGLAPILYVWNPNATSDATYLKWQEITSSSASVVVVVVASYAALRAYNFQSTIGAGYTPVALVLGYATAGDGGYGEFRYDSTDTASSDDNGRVLVTTLSSYRFKRIVKPGDWARPEWFGGLPEVSSVAGAQAVTTAARKCVAYYRSLEFSAGTYYRDNRIIVPRNTRVRGQGKGITIIKTVNASPAVLAYAGGNYMCTFMYCIAGTTTSGLVGTTYLTLSDEGPCDNSYIEDLTVDGNYNNQTVDGSLRYPVTIRAIELVGGGCRISRVSAQGCGVGLGGGECFIFRISQIAGQTNQLGGIIEDTDYSAMGSPLNAGATLAAYAWPTNITGTGRVGGWGGLEVTVIALSGDGGAATTQKAVRCTNNTVRDLLRTLTAYPNPLNFVSVAGSASAVITGNQATNFDGVCVYVDNSENGSTTQTTNGLNIANNNFDNVFRGVHLLSGVNTARYARMIVANNVIRLYNTANPPGFNLASPPIGILLDFNLSVSFVFSSDYPFKDIIVEGNLISGGGNFTPDTGIYPYYSRGVYFAFNNGDIWNSLKIINNAIDVPQYGPAAPAYYFQEADSLALYWVTSNALQSSTQVVGRVHRLLLAGNRTALGDLIPYMTVVDSGYLATYKQYQHDSVRLSTFDPIDGIANLDSIFPEQVGQLWFNTALKRLWIAQSLATRVASGSIVPQRSYAVRSDVGETNPAVAKITYNAVDYIHNQQFLAVAGVTVYTTLGDAKVSESPSYCWQPLTRNSYEIFQVPEGTYFNYGIVSDRFIDSRFFIHFNAGLNGDHRIALPNPATADASGNLIYKGRTCYIRYGRNAITDAHEIILACGTVAAGVLTPNASPVVVDPIACYPVDEVVLTPASKSAMGGIVGLLCDGTYWFITSMISDPQEILLFTQIGITAITPNDFQLTNYTIAPYYHTFSTNLKDRQLKGLVYLDFPLTANVGAELPAPEAYVGYSFKIAIRVGNGFTASVYCNTANKIINVGVAAGVKGSIVSTTLVASAAAADRIIVAEVTSLGPYWIVQANYNA